MNRLNLEKYGLTPRFKQEAALYSNLFIARVSEQHRDLYKVISENGELLAEVSGKFLFNAEDNTSFPVVGDWVMIDRLDDTSGNAVIHQVLTRKSLFERKAAGTSKGVQIVASNFDLVFICMSLNADFNLRRLERYLSIAWNSMATPVIVLTKADLCDDLNRRLNEISSVRVGTDVVVCSSKDNRGYDEIADYLTLGKTIAFIGSSGVGKSTIINRLMGEEVLQTKNIRNDDRGRHATTHRQLLLLPNGGIVIDTPGMRELHLDSANLAKSFEDIESLAENCRFRDCTHTGEPGCAVQNAIETGILSEKRFANYCKLQKEMEYVGLNSRQLEEEKIKKMFGSKGEMKQAKRQVKNKNKR
ncbi:ribosome small subunit-dependent GTPase A [Acetobacterium paludosum]|uniref:Small ribosomal subunit biogenesis GTPase RsgA n=1 Tax=Acetobacterium paludosum TaxID=52693 RepID=A0A923HW45_9FIRM|nr:ribosome small subunit-dependent GTPase A [Acetobacterium paludosum]MBC3889381.1 ribosome small subunit-dependent GTPase A [Acetobacterium paludosum]